LLPTLKILLQYYVDQLVSAVKETGQLPFILRSIGKSMTSLKLNSVALVRKLTIPTERPPHFGEVSTNFCG
jgi:hypothetical protein